MAVDPWYSDRSSTLPEPEQLLGEFEAFENALAAGGPIAVTGRPYAGRGAVLDHAAAVLGTDVVQLDPSEPARTTLDDDPLVLDHCQQLYTREIGGFELLRETLSTLSASDQTLVAGFNEFAWAYLDQIENISDVFAETFAVRPFSTADLETFVRDRRTLPSIEEDRLGDSLVSMTQYPVGWGRTIPIPDLDFAVLNDQVWPTPKPTQSVFDRLRSLSNGNPGVALALLDDHDGETISPSDLTTPDLELDDQGDFLLRLLLADERSDREYLAGRIGDRFDRLLGRLERAGFVTIDGDAVVLRPIGVPTAIERTGRRQML